MIVQLYKYIFYSFKEMVRQETSNAQGDEENILVQTTKKEFQEDYLRQQMLENVIIEDYYVTSNKSPFTILVCFFASRLLYIPQSGCCIELESGKATSTIKES